MLIEPRFQRKNASGSQSLINFLTALDCISQNHRFLSEQLPSNGLNYLKYSLIAAWLEKITS